jgi:hypothetical protein
MAEKMKFFNLSKFYRVLNDKNVLYIVFVIAILNLLGYLLVRNTEAVVFFLIVGFLTTYFSKNMIVVLLSAMISTSIFTAARGLSGYMYKEGMSTKKENKTGASDKANKSDNTNQDKDVDKKMSTDDELDEESKESKTTEPMTVSTSSHKKNRLDYASTMEKAFANLKHTVGEGGVEGLTNQTSKLIKQQEALMNNIKGLEPILKSAESFMNNLNIGGLEGIGGMLSKLGGKKE